jgi:hypothetical protein
MAPLKANRPLQAGESASASEAWTAPGLNYTPNRIPGQSPAFPVDPITVYPVALALLDAGYPLVPLKTGSKWIRAGYGPAQKHVTTYGEAFHWFAELGSNVGILSGGDPGLTVLDFDSEAVYQVAIERWPVLARTFTVRTATPGHYHVYTLTGDLPSGTAFGVEIKCRGRVVVGPASVVEGKRYTPLDWRAPFVRIDPVSFSLFSELTQAKPVALKKRKDDSGTDLVSRIKRTWSLVEVCESHKIKLAGSGRLRRAKCPFHDETEASFTIDLARGLWRCFGCGRHGDVVNLLAQLEGMTVQEAIRAMARRLPPGGAR